MGLIWFWDFGINLTVSDYDGSGWGPSTTTSVINTAYTSTLQSPSGGGLTPGDSHVCRLNTSPQLTTPNITSMTQGWLCGRWHWTSGTASNSSARPMLTGMLSGTERFECRAGSNGTSGVTIALYVATTLIGTSSTTYSVGDTLNLAIQFDVSGTNHSAGLYIDGIEEVAYTAGGGSPGATTINQFQIGCPNVDGTWNTLRAYSSRALDQEVAISNDVWSRTLKPNAFSQSASAWATFGAPADEVDGLSDGDSATGVESTTDPSSFDLEYEDRNDILSGWVPNVVYGLQAVMFASGDVVTDVTLAIYDDDGLINQKNTNPLPATPDFVTILAVLDSNGDPLTGSRLDQVSTTWTVT